MKHTQAATQQFKRIPREKLWDKTKRTIGGLLVVGVAAYTVHLRWPWYVSLSVGTAGGWLISKELTEKAVRFVVAMVKDVLSAVAQLARNGNGKPPSSGSARTSDFDV